MRRTMLAPLILICAGSGPCQQQTTSGPAPAPVPSAKVQAEPQPPPAPRRKQQTLTVTARMQEHFAEGDLIRRALIAGDLDSARKAGAFLAGDEWTTNLRATWKPHLASVQSAAQRVASAPDLPSAARAAGELGQACASCHEQVGKPALHLAELDPKAPAMARHVWAVDAMWWGLFVPADAAWTKGAEALGGAPLVLSDVPAVEAMAQRTYEIAQRARGAASDQRARYFGELLTTCASCHRSVGAELDLGPAAAPRASTRP
jgi:cytochrome c553